MDMNRDEQLIFDHWRIGTKLKDMLSLNKTFTPKYVSDIMHKITVEYWEENYDTTS
jgi:hypothetical protein